MTGDENSLHIDHKALSGHNIGKTSGGLDGALTHVLRVGSSESSQSCLAAPEPQGTKYTDFFSWLVIPIIHITVQMMRKME